MKKPISLALMIIALVVIITALIFAKTGWDRLVCSGILVGFASVCFDRILPQD